MCERESLVVLIDRWQAGDQDAAEAIFRRYEPRVRSFVERNLGSHLRCRVAPSEIINVALNSVLRIIREGDCYLDQNGSLTGLAAKKARDKINQAVEHNTAKKRDFRREIGVDPDKTLPHPASREPGPEDLVQFKDLMGVIHSRLKPDGFAIVGLKLEGKTDHEIAKELGVTLRTVANKKERLRTALERTFAEYGTSEQ